MALPLDQRIHLMGSIPIRVFFKKLQATSIAWLILSLVIGVVYLLDLFFGESIRSVSPAIPDWVFWLVFGAFALYYWRETLAAVAQYLMQTVQLGILALLSLVVLFVGMSLLGKVSGYLSCWFVLSYLMLFVLLELLDQEVQKWGEPWSADKTEFPKQSLNGSTRCPLSPQALKEETASFLDVASRGIPPSRPAVEQALSIQEEIQMVCQAVRDACVESVETLRERLIEETNKPDVDWYEALDEAINKIENAQIRAEDEGSEG